MGAVVEVGSSALDINGLTAGDPTVEDLLPIYETGAAANRKVLVREMLGLMRGHIDGLILANNAGDASNDLDIAAGAAVDSTGAQLMILASALTKRLDAGWTVGTNQGALDTGAEGSSTWYHVWLIMRSDTGVVDVLFSTSATAPTMPTSYDFKRRIGSFYNSSGSVITQFSQVGDEFLWDDPPLDVDVADQSTSSVSRTLSVPTGVVVWAIVNALAVNASAARFLYLRSLAANDEAVSNTAAPLCTLCCAANVALPNYAGIVRTNTSAQVGTIANGATTTLRIATLGWIDARGRNG